MPKILNTLWIHQINRFPDYSVSDPRVWTFRINYTGHSSPEPEFLQFRDSSNKLLGAGLVGETPDGQLFLTLAGFDYCKEQYKEFPPDKFFPETAIDQNKLNMALAEDQ